MQIFQIAATNPIKKSKDFDNPINAVKMQRRLCNALKPVLLVYIIYIQIVVINSETSILWKLNVESGNIDSFPEGQRHLLSDKKNGYDDDPIFKIILSTTQASYNGKWNRLATAFYDECVEFKQQNFRKATQNVSFDGEENDDDILDCGSAVNFTFYDDLIGIAQRYNHPNVPEPEVAYQFLKNKQSKSLKNFNIDVLEKRLKKAKREKPMSVQLFNQMGNFWRIKGDATKSIECFRRALSISPSNSEVLHNLARVLFNLQYLDDAIHLTRRSLEVQSPDRNAWRQYFTLGEIFKAYGHFQQSILHLRHALDLRPQHEPILNALRDVENIPSSTLHIYTIIIIVCLVIGVLLVILSTNDSTTYCMESVELKGQRHFNRAMAMRSLKGLAPRTTKYRKYY